MILRIPFLGSLGIRTWHNVNTALKKWKLQKLQFINHKLPSTYQLTNEEIEKVFCVSPRDIRYSSLVEHSFFDSKGLVLGGDWDKLDVQFEDLDIYVAFFDVIRRNKEWSETIFYKRTVSKIQRGELVWGCCDQKDFDKRCERLSKLVEDIKRDGYKSQTELVNGNKDDEITVNIGRNGDLLFSNSAHRLAIAKILEIKEIPVKIAVRHSGWIQLRNNFARFAVERDGKTYQPILHPDLQFIPSFHGCEDRFDLIRRNISLQGGSLLDLGANLGYFSSRFEDEGFNCFAVEHNPSYIYCLQILKRATNKHFEIINESILESEKILQAKYDVVLCLNIFHHFLKSKETFEKFEVFLENLKCRELYFEPHIYEESQMENAYKNFHPDEFVKLIQYKLNLPQSHLIGTATDGRPIYKIY